jgi:hypothetical protein
MNESCSFIYLQFKEFNSEDLPAEARAKSIVSFHDKDLISKSSFVPQEDISDKTVSTFQENWYLDIGTL